MKLKTLQKKVNILEYAFTACAGVYYSVNFSRDLVPGKVYRIIDEKEYCVSDQMGLPENARFTDVIAYWGNQLPEEEKAAYFSFFDITYLLGQYEAGRKHLKHTYWTKTVLGAPMLAEHHIIMYRDEVSGDICGISYIVDLTKQVESSRELGTERQFLDVICRDYTSVYFADLNHDIAEPLKIALNANMSQLSRIQLRKKICFFDNIRDYCEQYVVESNKNEFLHVMQPEHLSEELKKTDRFTYRYESVPNQAGHRFFEVQVVRMHEEFFDGNVMVAFHHIDDMITKEQRYQWELERIAYADALTGLGNRAAFLREMTAFENHVHAGCVVADVNNLKVCNDRYGHKEGDRIIEDAADCMRSAFENLGECYRIGGDEFCVLIGEADAGKIQNALERLEVLIAEKNETRAMPLSIACGYAVRENAKETMEQLFNRGDEMMYDVKYRMKQEFPVYREERKKSYLNVLQILSKSTDSYLFLWDITRDEEWFFGDIDREYALQDQGKPMCSTADMEAIIHPADVKMLHDDLQEIIDGKKQVHNMNYRWMNRQGEAVWISCRGKVLNDDKGRPFVMIGRVSDKSLRYLYNPLTKLFNKNKLLRDLKEGIFQKNRGYFMFLGIDNLGSINLRYGRSHGDDVIIRCAQTLEKYMTLPNVWQVENNCFAIYLDVDTTEEVRQMYDRILLEMMDVCTISAGVVQNSVEMFGDADNLYACAEIMFEKAKGSEIKTLSFFSEEDLKQRIKTIQFLEEMQQSIDHDFEGFYLCYQPQIKTGNYHLYGAEALLRYHSETHGEVYPNEFIPLLEKSKLINQVGMWVLETALRQCRKWRETTPDFRISVNFSAVQLNVKNIADKVLYLLGKTGLPGDALTIEITESTQMQEFEHFRDIFRCWREAGIELSIDDFGTGYASMSYLKELDVNEIKIDRLFVSGIEEATYNYRLISNMIEFAKSNEIRICCEGVEDMRELSVLEGLSPTLIQGYLFAKPCKKEEFERAFIDSRTSDYKEHEQFVQKIYQYKDRMHVIYFNPKDILRENDLGLWIIRINEEDGYHEMHADETMEHVMSVDKKYTPKECYDFWYSRIRKDYCAYVEKNVKRMMEVDKVVQLQYPWIHPELGEIMVRCSGKRVEDSDGMITLEGYHRIISTIEEN